MYVLIFDGKMVELQSELYYNVGTVKDFGFDPKTAEGMLPKKFLYEFGKSLRPKFRNISVSDPRASANYNCVMGYDADIRTDHGIGGWWISKYRDGTESAVSGRKGARIDITAGEPVFLESGDEIVIGHKTASPYQIKFRYFREDTKSGKSVLET